MQTWMKDIADKLGTKHTDLLAVIRAGKKGAKRRTVKHNRAKYKKLDKNQ